jgi:hypothetical protein
MFESLKALIGTARAKSAPSADLAAAVPEARREVEAAERAEAAAASAYAEGLLRLDDRELQALIDGRTRAKIRRDRAQMLLSTLETNLSAAREAEAIAALTTERAVVERELTTISGLIRTEYPKLATALVAMLERLEAADTAITAVNEKLMIAGRHDEILPDVQSHALPKPGPHEIAPSIWGPTRLAEIPGFAPGWHDAELRTGGMVIQSASGPQFPGRA